MIEWIVANMEWLFEGLGIAFIGGFLKLAHSWWKGRQQQTSPQLVQRSMAGTVPGRRSAPPRVLVTMPKTRVQQRFGLASSLTPETIRRSLVTAPPLQRPEIAKHYEAIPVTWDGCLAWAQPSWDNPELVQIGMRPSTASPTPCVLFLVRRDDYPGLGVLQEGAKIQVTGRIQSVEESKIELSEVKLKF